MDFCRTVERLYAALPLRPFRDWLIRTHMDRCPRCQERLLSREEARSLLVRPGQTGDAAALWRRISEEAGRPAPAPKAKGSGGRLAWQWAAASAMAAVLALTGFWLLRETGGPGLDAAGGRAGRPLRDRLCQGGRGARPDLRLPTPGDGHRLRLGAENSVKGEDHEKRNGP